VSAILLFFLLYRELTKRDLIESDLKKSLNEKKVLLNEVHHRVKNNLNSIISLLYLENLKAKSQDSKEIIETLSGRIYSMALVHEHLYKSEDFKEISLKDYIPGLAAYIKRMYPLMEKRIDVSCNVDDTLLDITKAIPLGILLNEIINNSFKHAFPFTAAGTISIEVRMDNNMCRLTIGDDGIGISDKPENPSAGSHGLELIRLLVNQLSGEINSVSASGLKYCIVFPVNG
jgi:two-component sensor histidine kinase